MGRLVPKPISRFLKVKCFDCGNVQIIFGKASSTITCLVCGASMAQPTGGKSIIKGEIQEVLE